MDAKSIVDALKGRWCGSYGMCRCPAHKDRTPSLKVADGASDVIVHCFAGCGWRDVKAELRRQGLLPEWEGAETPDPGLAKFQTRRQICPSRYLRAWDRPCNLGR